MDLPSLNAILRVNGLTKDSAPENITDVLLRSGYTQDEVPDALNLLKGAPSAMPSTPAAYVDAMIERTRVSSHAEIDDGSLFSGRIGPKQFWLSMLVAILVYGATFVITEASAIPIFSLVSGISLFSPNDLSTMPVNALLLFGIGMAMLILPALFLLAVSISLQIRRCHDFGLSVGAWFMAIAALVVGAYLGSRLTPLASLAVPAAVLLWILFMSWPSTKGENMQGSPVPYPSIWGALYGSYSETGCLNAFVKKFLLPLVYLQVFGIIVVVSIHSILPRAHLPNVG